MNFLTGILMLSAALMVDVVVELAAELSTDPLLDGDAGAIVEIAPAPPSDIVDTMPGATLRWRR